MKTINTFKGRRICQGMHIAERSLFLGISRILWAFNVEAPLDADGKKILPDPNKLTQGLFVLPEPFRANIRPRSQKHAAMIREQWDGCLPLLDGEMQWQEVPKGMAFSTYDPTKHQSVEF
jgi:hypothetical protein